MKASNIIAQLQSVLPNYTSYFSDELNVTSLTCSGTTVTAKTSVEHNLTTGDYLVIVNALTPFAITSLTRVDNIATAITNNAHDLTQGYQENVEIIDADQNEYNGIHPLLTVPNRKKFTYLVEDDPVTPATGTPKLIEKIAVGYNGWHQVTVIDPVTFTYQVEKTLESPAQGTIKAKTRARISGAVSLERAIQSYTKKNTDKMWGFVVLGTATANKDRQTFSDATMSPGKGEIFRQEIIQPFSVYIFVPTTSTISGRKERDQMDDVLIALCKSLLRVKFPSGFYEVPYSGVVFSSHSFYDYIQAYYIHEFIFETMAWIIYEDTVDPDYNVAFRDIYINYESGINPDAGTIMTDHIDLDNEPLD